MVFDFIIPLPDTISAGTHAASLTRQTYNIASGALICGGVVFLVHLLLISLKRIWIEWTLKKFLFFLCTFGIFRNNYYTELTTFSLSDTNSSSIDIKTFYWQISESLLKNVKSIIDIMTQLVEVPLCQLAICVIVAFDFFFIKM